MTDRPGGGTLASDLATSMQGSGFSFDRVLNPQQRPNDQTAQPRPGDRPVQPGAQGGVLELTYGEPQFDQKLAAGNYHTLRLKGLPQGVAISSWVDNNGFYMWFKNGHDNRQPHYLPPGLKTIEVGGYTQNVDEMRIQASLSAMQEADRARQGFTAVNERTNPLEFAKRMGGLGWEHLHMQENALRQAAQGSPNNPYFSLYLSDILVAQAFKPIMDQLNQGASRIDLNTPWTQQKLAEAAQEAVKAEQIARQYGGVRHPNMEIMPGLHPFGLNRYSYNPDMYWSGALYQGFRRETQIKLLQQYIARFSSVELPPILPPR
jgi:hypothetical protein